MVDLIETPGLDFSADELRTLTDWPDAVIEDYLELTRSVTQITQEVLDDLVPWIRETLPPLS